MSTDAGAAALPGSRPIREGVWRLSDPKISLASMASIFLGAAAAASEGAISWVWLALTVVGIFCIEVAKNASGEIYDWDSGADRMVEEKDRSPFSGGKRVLVDGLLTRRQTWTVATVGYAAAIAAGLAIVALREPRVLWIGVAGMACAFFYHAPPFRLSYRGLGEIAVAFCYGPLIAGGTYLVQRGEISGSVIPLSIALGVHIAAFLWINELPDCSADTAAGKLNTVARLGRPAAGRVFSILMAAPYFILALVTLTGHPAAALIGLIGGIPAAFAAVVVWKHPEDTSRLVPAQRATLLAFVLFSVGCGVGLLLK
jgi:1,4-dihydroxy-2-naphthoate octaprenyltransferase